MEPVYEQELKKLYAVNTTNVEIWERLEAVSKLKDDKYWIPLHVKIGMKNDKLSYNVYEYTTFSAEFINQEIFSRLGFGKRSDAHLVDQKKALDELDNILCHDIEKCGFVLSEWKDTLERFQTLLGHAESSYNEIQKYQTFYVDLLKSLGHIPLSLDQEYSLNEKHGVVSGFSWEWNSKKHAESLLLTLGACLEEMYTAKNNKRTAPDSNDKVSKKSRTPNPSNSLGGYRRRS